MAKIEIIAQPLTRDAFRPYGDVIDLASDDHYPINRGSIERHHRLADVEVDERGQAIISIMTCNQVSDLPYQIKEIECHPLSSQAFIPLTPIPMIIVVAAAGDNPEPTKLRGFISDGHQGVNYHAGTWHMPLISSRKDQQYLVVDRVGPGENCDVISLEAHEISVSLA